MTDKEKAIVMAHTGICMLTGDKFQIFHKYVEDIMGRPIMTHEIGWLADAIKEKSKADFIALCADESGSENPNKCKERNKALAEQALAIPSAEPSDEQVKEYCRRRNLVLVEDEFMAHIIKGTPQAYIYKGMTNEEVIKTVFPKAVLHTEYDDVYLSFQQGVYLQDKDTTWLNAPYKGEDE